jgi:hypothetical protein
MSRCGLLDGAKISSILHLDMNTGKTTVKVDPASGLLVRCARRPHRPKKEQQTDAADGRPSVGADLLLQRLMEQIK